MTAPTSADLRTIAAAMADSKPVRLAKAAAWTALGVGFLVAMCFALSFAEDCGRESELPS